MDCLWQCARGVADGRVGASSVGRNFGGPQCPLSGIWIASILSFIVWVQLRGLPRSGRHRAFLLFGIQVLCVGWLCKMNLNMGGRLPKPAMCPPCVIKPVDDIPAKPQVMLGIGLGSQSGLSKYLPLDVLMMIFATEHIAGAANGNKIIVLGDEQAKWNAGRNAGFTPEGIARSTVEYQNSLEKTVRNLGYINWSICLASDVAKQERYQQFLESSRKRKLPHGLPGFPDHEYVEEQAACMRYFQEQHHVNIKVGWTIPNGTKAKKSEESFDSAAVLLHPQLKEMKFVYTFPGLMTNGHLAVPYTHVQNDSSNRLLLRPAERGRVQSKVGNKPGKKIRQHLERLLASQPYEPWQHPRMLSDRGILL